MPRTIGKQRRGDRAYSAGVARAAAQRGDIPAIQQGSFRIILIDLTINRQVQQLKPEKHTATEPRSEDVGLVYLIR